MDHPADGIIGINSKTKERHECHSHNGSCAYIKLDAIIYHY